MFGSLLDLVAGRKLDEKRIDMQGGGTLKLTLKERRGVHVVVLRFSYLGNIQFHILHREDLGEMLHTLERFHARM